MVRIGTEAGFITKRVELIGQDGDGFDYTTAVFVKPPIALQETYNENSIARS
jgi:hypothetical protein